MELTISVRLDKGSLSHNNRKFSAKNVDATRTPLNKVYMKQNIKEAYHHLFDEAVKEYNAKQTKKCRQIDDYYEKIAHGKQEKLFYEYIVQVGSRDTVNCNSANSEIAIQILDDYMKDFQERNPNLYVFNVVMHLDEETPHLHINFIPYSSGHKRGVSTKNSFKAAMKAMGIVGNGKSQTENIIWADKEKEYISEIMKRRYNIDWKKLHTHEEHLSVLDFKKKMRTKEVKALESDIAKKKDNADLLNMEIQLGEKEAKNIKNEIHQKKLELTNVNLSLENAKHSAKCEQEELQKKTYKIRDNYEYSKDLYDIQQFQIEQNKKELFEYEETEQIMKKRISYYKSLLPANVPHEMFEDMVKTKQENVQLKEENRELRGLLDQAYDFMKKIVVDGMSVFQRFQSWIEKTRKIK